MAERIDLAENPVEVDDPRFDPESDAENALAHDEEPRDPEEKPDDLERIHATVQRGLERAVQHYEEELEPDQVEATKYYKGQPFGDEKKGRSRVVSTDVRDATLAQMPSLLRIFWGPEAAVEFEGEGPEDDALAEQMTDGVNYVLQRDNAGFLVFHSWFKDALVRRLGWVKWWWDADPRVEAAHYTGLSQQSLMLLLQDEGAEGVQLTGRRVDPELGETYDVRVTRRGDAGRVRVACVPPEEVVFTPDAKSVDDAPLIAHVREATVDELRQLGIDEDLIQENVGKERSTASDDLEQVRQFHGGITQVGNEDDALDDSQRPILYAEAYCWVDGDGDGVAELRMFQCVGPGFEVANGAGEIVDEVPLAPLCPEPEPHTLVGLSNFDLLKDVQRVKSQILRGTLDSLAKAIDPPTVIKQGDVNLQDLLNPDVHGIVRTLGDVNNSIREVPHMFVGPAALQMLGYYDEIRENRTGQTKAAQGLDADSLQSATKAAVAATITASQQRLEMITRIFAETGVKRLMKGVMGLLVKHQDRSRMVRLRNAWVEMDPRCWKTQMDLRVNVALGQGTPEDRIMALEKIGAAQQAAMQGGAPFVNWTHIRYTLGKAAEIAGWRHPEKFFAPWGAQEQEQMQAAQAQQQPPPDPQMMLVQIEAQKVQIEAQERMAKLELERWKAQDEADRKRDELARDTVLKERELEVKHSAEIRDQELSAQIERDRMAQTATGGE